MGEEGDSVKDNDDDDNDNVVRSARMKGAGLGNSGSPDSFGLIDVG